MKPLLWESLVLGAIQGATEFLPVSSDGHLALAEMLFDFSNRGLAFNTLLHLGTAAASVLLLWPRLVSMLGACVAGVAHPAQFARQAGARDAVFVLLTCLPTALVGFSLRYASERWTSSPLAIGLGLLGTCLALLLSRFAPAGRLEHPGLPAALMLGVAQGLAVLPGLSRSASTLALALLLGVRRDRAMELSVLMSIPAVLGAALIEMPRALSAEALLLPAALGATVAFGVGLVALDLLRRVVLTGRLSWFVLWVFPVALATLALAKAWPHG